MKTLDSFLEEYGGPAFMKVSFRPGAPVTSIFGFDYVYDTVRFHNAIDRGNFGKPPVKNPVYTPFAGYATWIPDIASFGSLFILETEYDFSVRIAHMEAITSEVQEAAIKKTLIPAGMYIGEAGNKGYSTGIHTHTEIVSLKETNPILDELMSMKFRDIHYYFTYLDLQNFVEKNKLSLKGKSPEVYWSEYCTQKGIVRANDYICVRRDYLSNTIRTFYSSWALFGF